MMISIRTFTGVDFNLQSPCPAARDAVRRFDAGVGWNGDLNDDGGTDGMRRP